MHVHFGAELLTPTWPASVACIGTFDGVHLGHQRVISKAVQAARDADLPCSLVTFDRHPAAVLAPDRCPGAISSLQANLARFEELGVSIAVILRFDKELSETTAQAFFDEVVLGKLKAEELILGHDFAFGKGREGDAGWLQSRIKTEVVPPFEIEGARVSSSEIRRAVECGDLEHARLLLGRPFEIPGIVVKGRQLGRTLGYPTVNLARSFRQVTPADGVYSGTCLVSPRVPSDVPPREYKAAISVGLRPTLEDGLRTIEAFLLDYPGNELYGEAVVLALHRKIRNQARFDSLELLREQMERDVDLVRRVD